MISRRKCRLVCIVVASVLSLSLASINSQAAWPTEKEAMTVAEEVKVMIGVGTAIVGRLQPSINASNTDPASVQVDHMTQDFLDKYLQAAGSPFDPDAQGLLGESRREFLESYKLVISEHQDVLQAGGVDSFVPAYFRSEVFSRFNERMGGRVKGYATNRDDDLLNPDWSIDVLMDYSLFAYYIQELLEDQNKQALLEKVAGRVVGYYPMKLEQSCVACHARQGLQQNVGAYGGALVTEVLLEK